MKLAVHEPFAPTVIGEPMLVPSQVKIIFGSLAAKPEPLAVIAALGGPLVLPSAKPAITLKDWVVTEDACVTLPEAPTA